MLGVTHPLDLLGTRAAGDKTNLLALVKELANAGFPLLFTKSGAAVVVPDIDGKAPIDDYRTPAMRKFDDAAAQQAAKAAGNPRWADVKSKSGRALATTDIKRLTHFHKKYVAQFGEEPNLALALDGRHIIVVDADQAADVKAFQDAWLTATGQHIEPTVLSPGVVTTNGTAKHKGGGHFYLTVPEGYEVPEGIEKWAPEGAGWEVMVRKSYVLLPPSVRAEGAYLYQGSIHDAPRDLLDDLADAAAQIAARRAEKAARRSDGPTNIDQWAQHVAWENILTPAGFSPVKPDSCGPDCMVYTAPGVHASPKSATAHEPGCAEYTCDYGHGPLHLWTDTLTPELSAMVNSHGRTVTKLHVVAAIEHGGDMGQACRALGISGDYEGHILLDLDAVLPAPNQSVEQQKPKPDRIDINTVHSTITAASPAPTMLVTSGDEHLLDTLSRLDRSGFWGMTPGLRTIHQVARAEGVGNWGLLGAALPRIAAAIPPHVRLVKASGREGAQTEGCSLNAFTVLVGPPEVGKTETMSVAESLIPAPEHALEVPEGTAEGIIKTFAEVKKVTDDDGVTEYVQNTITDTVIVTADEMTGVLAEMGRENSKFGTLLRSSWFGRRVGTTTGEMQRRTNLHPHTYRLTMTMGAQLSTVAPVFAEGNKGTPQRVMWLPATAETPDYTITVPGPLTLPKWECKRADGSPVLDCETTASVDVIPVWIHRPPAADAAIRAHRADRIAHNRDAFAVTTIRDRDDMDDVRGHELLHRLKVAVLLAALDGLTSPTDTHWSAAGVVMTAREATVRTCMVAAEAHTARELTKAGRDLGEQRAAARASETSTTERHMESTSRRMLQLLAKGETTKGSLRSAASAAQRDYVDVALSRLLGAGLVTTNGKTYRLAPYESAATA